MEISGGQGANGPHHYGLAPNFLEMGATVAPIFWSRKTSKCGFPTKYNKNFARASGARIYYPLNFRERRRKMAKFVTHTQEARSKLLTWPTTFECDPQLFRVGGHLGPHLFGPYFQRWSKRGNHWLFVDFAYFHRWVTSLRETGTSILERSLNQCVLTRRNHSFWCTDRIQRKTQVWISYIQRKASFSLTSL